MQLFMLVFMGYSIRNIRKGSIVIPIDCFLLKDYSNKTSSVRRSPIKLALCIAFRGTLILQSTDVSGKS